MRTDSPTETSTRFFAGRNSLISWPFVIVGCNLNNLNQQHIGNHSVIDPPLKPEPGRAIALPLAVKNFIVKPLDGSQSKWPRYSGNVFPFLATPQNLNRH